MIDPQTNYVNDETIILEFSELKNILLQIKLSKVGFSK